MHTSLTREFIAEFCEGQVDAFERVWEAHHPRILRTASRMGVAYDDLQDLLQDMRIALYTSRRTFAGTGDFSAWVQGVCRRRCLRWRRAQGRYQTCLTAFEPLVDPRVELDSAVEADAMAYDRRCERAMQALDTLTPRQREVVIRRALYQHSVAQVAAALQCSTGTVKATYHTALQHLRERLDHDDPSGSTTRSDSGSTGNACR